MAVVDVGVVGQHVDGQGLVLGAAGGVGDSDRAVIGAVNSDGDDLRGGGTFVVGYRSGERFRRDLALGQLIGVGIGVVERVGPCAGRRVDRKRAVDARSAAAPGRRG